MDIVDNVLPDSLSNTPCLNHFEWTDLNVWFTYYGNFFDLVLNNVYIDIF